MHDINNEPRPSLLVAQASPEEIRSIAEEMGHSSLELRNDWQRRAEAGDLNMFVAKNGTAVVASVNLLLDGPYEQAVRDEIGTVPTIIALDVKPDYRRQGIGSRLMDACEDYVAAQPNMPQKIALGVVEANIPARTMYEERGYHYEKVAGNDLFETSWPEVDANGNTHIHTAQCLLMVKDL